MTDLNEHSVFPDQSALDQLSRALWGIGSVRGAAILVGAGLSKNAQRPGDDTLHPPLWFELLTRLTDRLYPGDTESKRTNPLVSQVLMISYVVIFLITPGLPDNSTESCCYCRGLMF